MRKRGLTRQQAWRLEKIQQERQRRLQRKAQALAGDNNGALGEEQRGTIVAHHGNRLELAAADGAIVRCHLRQNLPPLAVGDRVVWQASLREPGVGLISALLPRTNLFYRADLRGEHQPLAANLDQILIVIAPLPIYSTDLLDQYLAAAALMDIEAHIVLNKTDLIDPQAAPAIEQDMNRYRTIGYTVLHSSLHGQGLADLERALCGKQSVLVGQSGVGKSSISGALLPQHDIKTGALAEQTGLGRHTTSTARSYTLPCGGALIDSPGVRDFTLWPMPGDVLARGFIEFRPFLGRCRFRNCSHRHEPGCALLQARAEGAISAERLASFQRLRNA